MNRRRFLGRGTLYAGAMGMGHVVAPGVFDMRPQMLSANEAPPNQEAIFSRPSLNEIDLSKASIITRHGKLPPAEETAAVVLVQEVEKRTGIRLNTSTRWPADATVIAITSEKSVPGWNHPVPARSGTDLPETRREGFRLYVDTQRQPAVVWIIGADPRGTLFGVGNLLRRMNGSQGKLTLASHLDIATAPVYEIRGHQLGYRGTPNTYDAWSPAQFEQYIRELTFFGANSVEGIPLQEREPSPLMKFPRREMNRAIGEICQRYGLEYWAWIPATFDLKDQARRQKLLNQCEEFFKDTPVFTGFSFPGGDPGSNPPELVLPFLEDVAKLLGRIHPQARVWLSLQHFDPPGVDYTFNYINRHMPTWLGGLVAGPGSPPMEGVRNRLPERYGFRDYPDITHQVRCQYPVQDWDQAYALTEGRESVSPRPAEYAGIFSNTAGYTNGFISYSEGVNDDVNKTLWSALGWDPSRTPREILVEYARVYFKPEVAERAATAILALEKNWHGPLVDNGAVEGTLLEWQQLKKAAPDLDANWRWQMCQLRANYDAYIQRRQGYEARLESKANVMMANAEKLGADKAMAEASHVLNLAVTRPISIELPRRISELCDKLFHSIGMQTSVKKYDAAGEERGAVLDFVNYPLNNRWWLEDQFKAIHALGSEGEKNRRLRQLATWEHPGPGSFYDDMGNIAKSAHVVYCYPDNGPELKKHPQPTFWWQDNGKSRARLSWQVSAWPIAIVYEGVDPNGTYVVRSTGSGQALLRINGERVESSVLNKQMEGLREFPVASQYVKNRKLVLTWDRPKNEEKLNWRNKSRLSEVWLIKES